MDALELIRHRALEIAVRVWHPDADKTLVAWHGLSRHGGDFHELARRLGPEWRVIAPDMPGRGLSSWSLFPAHDYLYSHYQEVALAVLDHFRLERVAWLGTSMGGLLGLLLSGAEEGRGRIERLIVNDVGPEIDADSLAQLASYFAVPHRFATFGALIEELQRHYAEFGIQGDDAWRRLALQSSRRLIDGSWGFHFDPRIAEQFIHDKPLDLWPTWAAIDCPLMAIRGARSTILSAATLARMHDEQPGMRVLEVAGCGHAPMLNQHAQVEPIRDFLDASTGRPSNGLLARLRQGLRRSLRRWNRSR